MRNDRKVNERWIDTVDTYRFIKISGPKKNAVWTYKTINTQLRTELAVKR